MCRPHPSERDVSSRLNASRRSESMRDGDVEADEGCGKPDASSDSVLQRLIIIEDGAYFKGSIDIVKPEPKPEHKAAAAPRVQQAAQSANPAGNAAPAAAGEVKR